ncbi:hypothetical protein SKAU_G00304380 [Synaphobranchus kaupii]|uniref:Uncharacterized protein n=1 Tax=Synaphobranchus kaupii TaxID=118154 RepID=A0A9Q1EWC2_SYNKA|nr:hypothetical protein SKAU_G00304380 [Synaphobranchus kaupii]
MQLLAGLFQQPAPGEGPGWAERTNPPRRKPPPQKNTAAKEPWRRSEAAADPPNVPKEIVPNRPPAGSKCARVGWGPAHVCGPDRPITATVIAPLFQGHRSWEQLQTCLIRSPRSGAGDTVYLLRAVQLARPAVQRPALTTLSVLIETSHFSAAVVRFLCPESRCSMNFIIYAQHIPHSAAALRADWLRA